MSALRNRYFRTLGLGLDPETAKLRQTALTRACERRNFEIEHYWKRATYFWAFEAAIFVALGFLWGRPDAGASPITILLAGLGIMTAFTNTLAAWGSRFWQENWEKHIDMLEDEFEGRLYKTVWLDEGKVSYSVSRVNLSLGYCFIGFWLLVFVYVVGHFLKAHGLSVGIISLRESIAYVIVVIFMIGGAIFWFFGQTTTLRGTIPRSDGSSVAIQSRSRWQRRIYVAEPPPCFISRYAPDEDPH